MAVRPTFGSNRRPEYDAFLDDPLAPTGEPVMDAITPERPEYDRFLDSDEPPPDPIKFGIIDAARLALPGGVPYELAKGAMKAYQERDTIAREISELPGEAKQGAKGAVTQLAQSVAETKMRYWDETKYAPEKYLTDEQRAEIDARTGAYVPGTPAPDWRKGETYPGQRPASFRQWLAELTPEQRAQRDRDIFEDRAYQQELETSRLLGEEAKRELEGSGWMGEFSNALVRMVPAIGTGTLLSMAGQPHLAAAASLGIMNTDVYAQEIAEGRAMGLDEPTRRDRAALMSLAETIPEIGPVGQLFFKAGRSAVETLMRTGLSEGASEVITEFLQMGFDKGLYDENASLGEALKAWASPEGLQQMAKAGIMGFAMGVSYGAPSAIASATQQRTQANAMARTQRAADAVLGAQTVEQAIDEAMRQAPGAENDDFAQALDRQQQENLRREVGVEPPAPTGIIEATIAQGEPASELETAAESTRQAALERVQQLAGEAQQAIRARMDRAPAPYPEDEAATPETVTPPAEPEAEAPVVPLTPAEEMVVDQAIEQSAPAATDEPHEYGSTQVRLGRDDANAIKAAAVTSIDPADVDPVQGLEDEPHITVLYGLEAATPETVQRLLADQGPVSATVGGIEIFQPEGKDYDVVVQRVDSPDLTTLHQRIKDELPNTQTFPDYKPHITLGYVKRGQGQKYAGLVTGLEGRTLTFDAVELAQPDETVTPIALEGRALAANARAPEQATAPVEAPSAAPVEPAKTVPPFDPRLKRQMYLSAIEDMAGQLVKHGGVTYVRNELGHVIGRTGSENPDWFQRANANGSIRMTTDEVRAAVGKALAGQKLGPKQQRIVRYLLDEIGAQRRGEEANETEVDRRRAELAERRARRRGIDVPVEAYEQDIYDQLSEMHEEQEYSPVLDFEGRTIFDLAQALQEAGGNPDPILETVETNEETIDRLEEALEAQLRVNRANQGSAATAQAQPAEQAPAGEAQAAATPEDESGRPAGPVDLAGPVNPTAQAIADRQRRLDEQRNRGQTDLTGTMFGQDRQQTDLTDAAAAPSATPGLDLIARDKQLWAQEDDVFEVIEEWWAAHDNHPMSADFKDIRGGEFIDMVRAEKGEVALNRLDMRLAELLEEETPAETAPEAAPAAPKINRKTGAPEITDFGQVIPGAARDRYRTSLEALSADDLRTLPFSKSFPEPNYAALLADGVPRETLAMVSVLRESIPQKPRNPRKLARWLPQMETMRTFAMDVLAGKYTAADLRARMMEARELVPVAAQYDLLLELGFPETIQGLRGYTLKQVHFNLFRGQENVTKWELRPEAAGRTMGGMGGTLHFDTREEAVEALRGILAAPAATKAGRTTLDIYRPRNEKDVAWIGKKVAAGKYLDLRKFEGKDAVKQARTYLKEHEAELLAELEKRKDLPYERREINEPRVGEDYRGRLRRRRLVQLLVDRANSDAKRVSDALIAHSARAHGARAFKIPSESALSSGADSVNAALKQSSAYMTAVNANFLGNLNDGGALSIETFGKLDVPSKRAVLASVIGLAHDANVRGRIVELIPVDVMRLFVGKKFAAESLLGNESMLGDLLAVNDDPSVAAPDADALQLVQAVARAGAELASASDFVSDAMEGDPAVEAGQFDHLLGESGRSNDVTPAEFQNTFSFFGVQFGNWVEGDQRQKDLNEAYDALMDLSKLLAIPPRALSLDGQLGLAFGARGKGGKRAAKAHYEPDHVVINLTKKKGAGSLAHEWWHALDNHLSKRRGQMHGYITEQPRVRIARDGTVDASVRPEVLAAYENILRAIRDSGLVTRSRVLDETRTQDYWGTPVELTARAFERFIIDRAASVGGSNDYLANIVGEDFWNAAMALRGEERPAYPYPTEAEAPAINDAYATLFKTLETKPTDAGIALFDLPDPNLALGFYSHLRRVAEGLKQERGSPRQMLAMLEKAPGVKAEEVEWTGLREWLEAHEGPVTRQQIVDYLDANGVQIREVQLGMPQDGLPAFDEVGTGNPIDHDGELFGGNPDDGNFTAEDPLIYPVLLRGEPLEGWEVRAWPETSEIGSHWTHELLIDGEFQGEGGGTWEMTQLARHIASERGLVRKSRPDRSPMFPEYVLPGGRNYREILLHLPETSVEEFDARLAAHPEVKRLQGQLDALRKQYGEIADAMNAGEISNAEGSERLNPIIDRIAETNRAVVKAMERAEPGLEKRSPRHRRGHFGDVAPNILAHVRVTDRTGPNGEKILFIEELQSDWHQEGRRVGYRGYIKPVDPETARKAAEWDRLESQRVVMQGSVARILTDWGYLGFNGLAEARRAIREHADWATRWDVSREAAADIAVMEEWRRLTLEADALYQFRLARDAAEQQAGTVPDAPFKNNAWAELALKRMVRMAAEEGYDTIAWTTGDQQNDRYKLAQHIHKIEVRQAPGDNYRKVTIRPLTGREIGLQVAPDGTILFASHGGGVQMEGRPLSEVVGQAVAQRIVNDPIPSPEAGDPAARNYRIDDAYRIVNPAGEVVAMGESRRHAEQQLAYLRGEHEDNQGVLEIDGEGLSIGGDGMRGFYDRIVSNTLQKVARRLDPQARTEDIEILTAGAPDGAGYTVHFVEAEDADSDSYYVVEDETGAEVETFDDEADAIAEAARLNNVEPKGEAVHALRLTPTIRRIAVDEGLTLFAHTPRGWGAVEGLTTLTAEEMQKAIEPMVAGISKLADVTIEIVPLANMPSALRNILPDGRTPAGGIMGNRIYLFEGMFTTARYLQQTLMHELVGHYGIEKVFGARWPEILEAFRALKKRSLASKGAARFKELWADVERRYAGFSELNQLREFIAIASEHRFREGSSLAAFMRKVREAFVAGLRALGFRFPMTMTDIDLMLSASQRYVKVGPSAEIGLARPVRNAEYRYPVPDEVPTLRDRVEAGRPRRPKGTPQGDLFSSPVAEAKAIEKAAEDLFKMSVQNQEVGTVRIGVDRVTGPGDVAHVVAPFRKKAQESVLAVVTGEGGRVLEVQRHSIGNVDSAAVAPTFLLGAAVAVPGAKEVWFAHQHPSGNVDQSRADIALMERLNRLLRSPLTGEADAGVVPRGMIVVAPGSLQGTHYDAAGGGVQYRFDVTPARRGKTVSVTERTVRYRAGTLDTAFTSPRDMWRWVNQHRPNERGVLLMNAQHQPVAFIPMTKAEMGALSPGGPQSQKARLMRSVHRANASAVAVITPDESVVPGGASTETKNLHAFLANVLGQDVRVLDTIGKGGESWAEKGDPAAGSPRGTYASLDQEQTPEFRRWFGDSKVADAQGRPLVVYHGSRSIIDQFAPSRGGEYGSGIYFSPDEGSAWMYAERAAGTEGINITPVYLSIKNPFHATGRDMVRSMGVKRLEAMGYDGIIATGPTGERQYIAFRPEQIKSAVGNRGTFDPENPSILFSLTPPPLRTTAPTDIRAPRFADPDTEARFQEARKGLADQRTLIERTRDYMMHTWHGFSRHHIDLPREAKFALAGEHLRQFEAAPQAAKEEAIRRLVNIVRDLSKAEFDVLGRKIILDDLAFEVEQGHELPFGFTPESLARDKAVIDALVAESTVLQQRLLYRSQMQDALRRDLIEAGILSEEANNPAYYRHQVLMYARARVEAQGVRNVKTPKPGYAKRRMGSLEDINANYLEAEFDYLHRALVDLKTVETIEKIRRDYDISEDLKRLAKEAESGQRDLVADDGSIAEGEPTGEAVSWRSLVPEGYMTWQPDKGNLFYTGLSMPERMMNQLVDALEGDPALLGLDGVQGVSADLVREVVASVRQAVMMGGKKFEMVLPEELARTLDNMRADIDSGFFDHVLATPLRMWKQWVLINPRRVLKYNLNNLSGDLDAVIAGNPRALRKLPVAIRELWQVMRYQTEPSARYKEAIERGVFDAGLTVQEIPDINLLDPFEHIIERPSLTEQPLRFVGGRMYQVWKALRDFTRFRENWMRYAAYLDYVERLEGGEPIASVGYGAANPEMVDEYLAGGFTKDAAALLARDMVGDYGDVSHFGQGIRAKLIPFYSWMEINTRRYVRLLGNAWKQGMGPGLRAGTALAVGAGARTTVYLGVRMALVYALVQAWNWLVMGDEEDELSDQDRVRLHINLGRGDDGEIRTLRFQGALSDFLQWFGFEDAVAAYMGIEKGRASWEDVAIAIGKGPVNKVVGGLTPVLKTPIELASGQSYFPDVFNPRASQGHWTRDLARLVSLEHEYDWLLDKPTRGYGKSWQQALVYQSDAGEAAYNKIRSLAYRWNKRERGMEGVSTISTPRSEAYYEYRQALRFGDEEAAAIAYQKLKDLGVKGREMRAARKRAAPLAPIAKKDRKEFKATLTPRELESLEAAEQWYREVFLRPRPRPQARRDELDAFLDAAG